MKKVDTGYKEVISGTTVTYKKYRKCWSWHIHHRWRSKQFHGTAPTRYLAQLAAISIINYLEYNKGQRMKGRKLKKEQAKVQEFNSQCQGSFRPAEMFEGYEWCKVCKSMCVVRDSKFVDHFPKEKP